MKVLANVSLAPPLGSPELAATSTERLLLDSEPAPVKTMRLRYAGTCEGCGAQLDRGVRAHWVPARRVVRCLDCGTGGEPPPTDPRTTEFGEDHPLPEPTVVPDDAPLAGDSTPQIAPEPLELAQGVLPRGATCDDCGRRLAKGTEVLLSTDAATVLCLECIVLETTYTLGTPGAGARREHARRRERHETKVRTAHPRLGRFLLRLADDPAHVRAWATGAVGEEEFGRRLSGNASETLAVLHDRKIPRSSANVDHLAVTSQTVWVMDAKRYKGRVETRGHGLFSRKPPDLFVGGRNQMKLVAGLHRQVEVVREILAPFGQERGIEDIPVRGALVFVHADFGMFAKPFAVDGVWVGWGKAIRQRLTGEGDGPLPVGDLAKRLARELRGG